LCTNQTIWGLKSIAWTLQTLLHNHVINYTLVLLLNHGVEIPTTFANSPLIPMIW
jgi:hypothetical protein